MKTIVDIVEKRAKKIKDVDDLGILFAELLAATHYLVKAMIEVNCFHGEGTVKLKEVLKALDNLKI